MNTPSPSPAAPVVVVGASGDLGGRVLARLACGPAPVRALLRGSHDRSLPPGVQAVHGDLLDPASLTTALTGARALVSTATGYSDWKHPNPRVDSEGNRNLIDAAVRAGVKRFVFTSVLAADQAHSVQPFWQKKLTEDCLDASGLSYLALRAGTIIGGQHDFWARDLSHGPLSSLIGAHTPTSIIHIDQLAGYLAAAVDPALPARGPIDIAANPPATYQQLAQQFSTLLDRPVKPRGAALAAGQNSHVRRRGLQPTHPPLPLASGLPGLRRLHRATKPATSPVRPAAKPPRQAQALPRRADDPRPRRTPAPPRRPSRP